MRKLVASVLIFGTLCVGVKADLCPDTDQSISWYNKLNATEKLNNWGGRNYISGGDVKEIVDLGLRIGNIQENDGTKYDTTYGVGISRMYVNKVFYGDKNLEGKYINFLHIDYCDELGCIYKDTSSKWPKFVPKIPAIDKREYKNNTSKVHDDSHFSPYTMEIVHEYKDKDNPYSFSDRKLNNYLRKNFEYKYEFSDYSGCDIMIFRTAEQDKKIKAIFKELETLQAAHDKSSK